MAHICQRFERALRSLLVACTSDDLQQSILVTSGGAVIQTDDGLAITTTTGSQFDVNWYIGQSEDVQELPKVIVTCSGARAGSDRGAWVCDAHVDVVFEADSTFAVSDQAAAMEEVSASIANALEFDRFIDDLSSRELQFSALCWRERPSAQRMVVDRRQTHRFSLAIECVAKYLEP